MNTTPELSVTNAMLTPAELARILPEVCKIAFQAGLVISRLYHQEAMLDVIQKSDGTPVTLADKMADDLICKALSQLTPNIPLITEESVANVPFETRQAWSTYWLVDPLDGTKEFIERTGEFSVNIALIQAHEPVLGVVYGPETGDLYFAQSHQGAYKLAGIAEPLPIDDWSQRLAQATRIHANRHSVNDTGFQVAVSRRHGSKTDHFMNQLTDATKIRMGSALKTCLVAEGRADVYPRFGPTSLWDTAAAQCVLEAAGGAILNAAGHRLQYVQTESLLNPFFISVCDADFPWPPFPEML